MMLPLLKRPFVIMAVMVSSSVVTAFMTTYKSLAAVFNVRDLSFIAAMFAVLLFMVFMIWNLRTVRRPDHYILEAYNTVGEEDHGFRQEYKNYDVAVSYMLMYRQMYPSHKFILVSKSENSKKTVHKYLDNSPS